MAFNLAKFNVGDKIRFTNARKIFAADQFRDGDVTEIIELHDDGAIRVSCAQFKGDEGPLLILTRELKYIEKVEEESEVPTFKIGDKIIIENVRGIMGGSPFWRDGDISEVVGIEHEVWGMEFLRVKATRPGAKAETFIIGAIEYDHIRKVEDKPTPTHKFEVGDKVRAVRATHGWGSIDEGDIGTITELPTEPRNRYTAKFPKQKRWVGREECFELIVEEAVETTEAERITALESEVAALKAKVAELEEGRRKLTATITVDSKDLAQRIAAEIKLPTPNEQRKDIIAEAKAFLEGVRRSVSGIAAPTMRNSGEPVSYQDVYTLEIRSGYLAACRAEYHVNAEKRTVAVLLKGLETNTIYAKAVAKCAPDDIFNADIGKAIALGRALGLDVSKFEHAVKPTEFVLGHKIHARNNKGNDFYLTVEDITANGNVLHDYTQGWNVEATNNERHGYKATNPIILDDTNAEY